MTPVRYPEKYNKAHTKSKLVIERTFGVVKRIFSCIRTGMRIKVETTLSFEISCVVMYNFMRMRNIIDLEEAEYAEETTEPDENTCWNISYSQQSLESSGKLPMHTLQVFYLQIVIKQI